MTQQIRSGQILDGTIVNADVAAAAAIAWSKIDKTGAVLPDLGGAISWAQLPTGAGTWTATPTIETSGALTLNAASGAYLRIQRAGVGRGYFGVSSVITGGSADNIDVFSEGALRLLGAAATGITVDATGATNVGGALTVGGIATFGARLIINPGAIGNAYSSYQVAGVGYAAFGLAGAIKGNSDKDFALFAETTFGICFMVNGDPADAFKIGSTGDWLRGSNVMDGVGVPTIASGGGSGATIAGRSYAFVVTIGSSPGAFDIVVNFGRTFANVPVIVANYSLGGIIAVHSVSTTSATFGISGAPSWTVGHFLRVLVRGY